MPQHDEPALVPAPPLPPGPRHALVIATARYDDAQLRRLRSPVKDAEDFAAVLADPVIGGFAVETLVDETEVRIRRAIARFLHQRAAEDTVLIYLSCHGLQDRRGRLLFAARDTETPLPHASAVRAAELLDELDECKAHRQILILDCCFSGSFGDKSGGTAGPALEQQFRGHSRGREILTASGRFEYSYEGKPTEGVTTGSVFTTGLVEGLRSGAADSGKDGHITVEEAYDYAFRYVQRDGSPQTPQRWLMGGEGDPIVLARSAAGRAVAPAPLPAELRENLESRFPGLRIGAVNVIAEWLTDPDPARVVAARRLLENVAENDNRRVAEVATAHLERVRPQVLAAPAPARRQIWGSRGALRPPHTVAAILEGHTARVWGVAFSPDGVLLASAEMDGAVVVWDVASGDRVRVLEGHTGAVLGVAFRSDGVLLASAGMDGTVVVWDVASGDRIRVLKEQTGWIQGVAFSRDGVLASAGMDGTVRVWDAATGALVLALKAHPGRVWGVVFSPDGVLLASAGGDGAVVVWDAASGDRVRVLEGHTGVVYGVAFSPDGVLLASAGVDGAVRVWDAASGVSVRVLEGHTGRVRGVAFSPDGVLLASAGDDGTVQVWDAASGALVSTLEGHEGYVWRVAFDPVKPLLASAGYDGKIRLWK